MEERQWRWRKWQLEQDGRSKKLELGEGERTPPSPCGGSESGTERERVNWLFLTNNLAEKLKFIPFNFLTKPILQGNVFQLNSFVLTKPILHKCFLVEFVISMTFLVIEHKESYENWFFFIFSHHFRATEWGLKSCFSKRLQIWILHGPKFQMLRLLKVWLVINFNLLKLVGCGQIEPYIRLYKNKIKIHYIDHWLTMGLNFFDPYTCPHPRMDGVLFLPKTEGSFDRGGGGLRSSVAFMPHLSQE